MDSASMKALIEENLDYLQRRSISTLSHCIQIKAPVAGPHVVIVGGTHGNEPCGVAAMIAFDRRVNEGRIELKAGTVSLLLGNPSAYACGARYIEHDLNRIFSTQSDTTVEGRRARSIRRFFSEHPDIVFCLDLHSVSIGDFQIVAYNIENPKNEILALKLSPIDLHLAYHIKDLPGALIDTPECRSGLMVECGNHHSETALEIALAHIRSTLSYFGISAADVLPAWQSDRHITQYETIRPIVPGANFGFTIEAVSTGYFLKAGSRFATDSHGDHYAPDDCYVVVPSLHVRHSDADAGFLCRLRRL